MAQPTTHTGFVSEQEQRKYTGKVLARGQNRNPFLPWLSEEGGRGGERGIGIKLMESDIAGRAYIDSHSVATGGPDPNNVRTTENAGKIVWSTQFVERTRWRKDLLWLKDQKMVTAHHELNEIHEKALGDWLGWWSTLYMSTRLSCGTETIDQTPEGGSDAIKIAAYKAQFTGTANFLTAANQASLGLADDVDSDYINIRAGFADSTEGVLKSIPANSWNTLGINNLISPRSVQAMVAKLVDEGMNPLNGVIEDMETDIPSYLWFLTWRGMTALFNHPDMEEQDTFANVRGPVNPWFKSRPMRKRVWYNQVFVAIHFPSASADLDGGTTLRTDDTSLTNLKKEEGLVCGQESLAYAAPMWSEVTAWIEDAGNELHTVLDTMDGAQGMARVEADLTTRNNYASYYYTASTLS